MNAWALLALAASALAAPSPRAVVGRRARVLRARRVGAAHADQGKDLKPGLGARAAAALAAAVAFACAVAAGLLLPAAAGAVAAFTAWRQWRTRQRRKVAAAGVDHVVEGLEALVAALRSGAHPVAALTDAATQSPPPVAAAFRAAAVRAHIGASVPAGLAARAGNLPALAPVGPAWAVAETTGIALAEALTAVRDDLLARQQFHRRTAAALAGARATTQVLAGLPVLGVGLGELIGARPTQFLLFSPAGGAVLLVGVVLACAGVLWAETLTGKVGA